MQRKLYRSIALYIIAAIISVDEKAAFERLFLFGESAVAVRIVNSRSIGNSGNGLSVDGDLDVEIDNCDFSGNQGNGISLRQSTSLIRKLGLPEDTSPRELADLLLALQSTPVEQRSVAVESNGSFKRWVARGVNAASLCSNLVTIAGEQHVQEIIKKLLE